MRSLLRRRPAAAVLAVAGLMVVATGPLAPAHSPTQPAMLDDCPESTPQRLPADAIAGAVQAALAQAPQVYPGLDLTGMRAITAMLPRYGVGPDSRAVSIACGRTVRQRTVLVYLRFPAMRPSASLSQGLVAVSRFDGAYQVWGLLH